MLRVERALNGNASVEQTMLDIPIRRKQGARRGVGRLYLTARSGVDVDVDGLRTNPVVLRAHHCCVYDRMNREWSGHQGPLKLGYLGLGLTG